MGTLLPRRLRAFTLSELMAVVAIVATLLAIFGMAIANAKANAKRATCAFNLRQMSISLDMYLVDYDDTYPQTKGHTTSRPDLDDASGSIELPQRGSMLSLLAPYGVGIPDCPSDPDPSNTYCNSQPDPLRVSSYTVNGYFVWGLNQAQILKGVASTIIVSERRNSGSIPPNCDVIYRPWYNNSNSLAPQNDMDPTTGAIDTLRHLGGSNYLFADEHAVWKIFSQTYGDGINLHTPY